MLDWRMREAPRSPMGVHEQQRDPARRRGRARGQSGPGLRFREKLWSTLGTYGSTSIVGTPDWVHTGGGLNLRPRDMAKWGNRPRPGRWRGQQLVSQEWWIPPEHSRAHDGRAQFRVALRDYGYLWWRLRDQDVIATIGAQGLSHLHLTNHRRRRHSHRPAIGNEMRAINLFYTFILAAAPVGFSDLPGWR